MMNKKKQLLSVLLLVVLIVATVYIVLKQDDPAELWAALTDSNPWYLLLACACMVLYTVFEGFSLRAILNSLGEKLSVFGGFKYAAIDVCMSDITPFATGGQPFMLYYMSKDKIPLTKSSMAALLHTAEWTTSILLWSVVMFICRPSLWNVESENFTVGLYHFCLILGILFSILLVSACLLCMFSDKTAYRIAAWIVRLGAKIRVIRRPEETLDKLAKSIQDYKSCALYIEKHWSVALRSFGYSVVQRLSFFATTYFVVLAMGKQESFLTVIAIQALIALAGCAIPIPGTVGVTEWITFALMGRIFSDKADMLAAMALIRFVNFYLHMIFCAIVTAGNHVYVMKRDARLAAESASETADETDSE